MSSSHYRPTWHCWWMLAPAGAVYGLFVIVPFLETVWLSFRESSGLGLTSRWVGLANYRRALQDAVLGRALLNNAAYGCITLIVEVMLGLALAVLIHRCRRGQTLYRIALAAPLLIALVASAILWRNLLGLHGPINTALQVLGLDSLARVWLGPERIVYTISIMSGWAYCGFYMLLFSAGLQRVGQELREAARLDGAEGWRLFWHIERPLLRPVLVVSVVLCVTGAFRVFDLFYVMVGASGVPEAEVAATWVVKSAFKFQELGYAAAMAVLVAVLLAVLSAVLLRLVNRTKEVEL
ncbi:MAG: sugar ABC transporter permease [Phycisphaerae bacterium]|nr:sugar ABC transporter permease [Phycisphaerae bacterium]